MTDAGWTRAKAVQTWVNLDPNLMLKLLKFTFNVGFLKKILVEYAPFLPLMSLHPCLVLAKLSFVCMHWFWSTTNTSPLVWVWFGICDVFPVQAAAHRDDLVWDGALGFLKKPSGIYSRDSVGFTCEPQKPIQHRVIREWLKTKCEHWNLNKTESAVCLSRHL